MNNFQFLFIVSVVLTNSLPFSSSISFNFCLLFQGLDRYKLRLYDTIVFQFLFIVSMLVVLRLVLLVVIPFNFCLLFPPCPPVDCVPVQENHFQFLFIVSVLVCFFGRLYVYDCILALLFLSVWFSLGLMGISGRKA